MKTAIISVDEFPDEVDALKKRFGFVQPASLPAPQTVERPPVPPPAVPIPQSLPPVQPMYLQPPPVQQVEYILKKDDKDDRREKNNMITRLYAMNLVGDVDFVNKRVTNFRPPKMTAALDSVLCQKTKEQRIRHFKSEWETNLFEEEEDEHYDLNILVS